MNRKPIKNYEGLYEVSDAGLVRSVTRVISDNKCPLRIFKGKTLSQWELNGKQPYYCVSLCKNGKKINHLVHRLVAESFIDNPLHKEQVNHKDGNIHNNDISNLEWCTNAENTQHAYDNFLNKKKQLHIEYNGKVHSLRKWCTILNLNYKQTYSRYRYLGWSIEKCFKGGNDHVKY